MCIGIASGEGIRYLKKWEDLPMAAAGKGSAIIFCGNDTSDNRDFSQERKLERMAN